MQTLEPSHFKCFSKRHRTDSGRSCPSSLYNQSLATIQCEHSLKKKKSFVHGNIYNLHTKSTAYVFVYFCSVFVVFRSNR